MLRALVVLVALAGAAAAGPAPITFRLKTQVSAGDKPAIEVTATQAVSEVRIDLTRADGKKFSVRQGAMAAGQVAMLPFGDGAAGKTSWKCTFAVRSADGPWTEAIEFDSAVLVPIKFQYDIDHLDLDKHVLQFKVSRAIDKATLDVIGEDGKSLGKGGATYGNEPADAWRSISWTQPAGARVAQLKLRATAADGGIGAVDLTPWSVEVDHEDVNFATDSSTIEASETAKLDASLAKITETIGRVSFIKMQLYVAGHTDTVGPGDKNMKLSGARALAIAKYFRSKGLTIPIAIAGYGEEVLKVPTPQETDERRNRRADYVLGPAGGVPPFKGAYRKVHATWTPVK